MADNVKTRKKLIEVALPLDAINAASILEKQPFTRGHPRSLHIWWARRPLAAARAVIFSQMVDDPSSHPDIFKDEKSQEKERQRLFRIIEKLVKWENTTNEDVLQEARDDIWVSWRRACADNKNHPQVKKLFNPDKLPSFHDPFAGGGALPLEAQRLGLEAYASDLNPVAVLICKAMIEIPPKFADQPPVNPESHRDQMKLTGIWKNTSGLADDLRYYGQWIRDKAEKRISHLYPKVEITADIVQERPDLKPYLGQKLTVIAWIWARTVKSPNPAFANVDVPLASTFMLSTKAGREAYIEPVIQGKTYHFKVKNGKPNDMEAAKSGTKLSRANFKCLMSETPISNAYIREEAQGGRMKTRLMAVVAEGQHGRVYLSPSDDIEQVAAQATPKWKPDLRVTNPCHDIDRLPMYGMPTWGDAFTLRQLTALNTFSDLVAEVQEKVYRDAIAAGLVDDGKGINEGGNGATAYREAISIYMAMALSRWSDLSNTICSWNNTNQNIRALFARQAIPMSWDFAELSPFSKVGSWYSIVESSIESQSRLCPNYSGCVKQLDATTQNLSINCVVSTDPPYYDNIGYADLSDFFYVWMRRSIKDIYPNLFATLAVPKAEELVATPYRHGSKPAAEAFFLNGMTKAMQRLAEQAHPAFPITIYYAFKQSEIKVAGTTYTGWETFLEAVVKAGLAITGTWPMRTEREARSTGIGTNALASSIVLVCRPREHGAKTVTRREFLKDLKKELPTALSNLQRVNIAPVDLQQAILGPGMAVYTRYAAILDTEGNKLTVGGAITHILQTLDEVLAEQEGDFDNDTRWALVWFDQYGFKEAEYGVAETLSKSKNTSVEGMKNAGIIESGHGKVRLLKASELPEDWDPAEDKRLTVWEMVHHLIKSLQTSEQSAAELMAKLGSKAEPARELAYRLFTLSERRKRSADAIAYNSLVQAWPEIARLAQELQKSQPFQTRFDV